ncbi:transmembrane protein 181-like [Daphnia pulicaria]|uniref:transmembrane protein 181-like n=1 Tax=Daphnia pulicaria TaxID=35523 RepID=UPI001EEC0721|nr:transmembrane protein 181-like [Daphnia pulicaria]
MKMDSDPDLSFSVWGSFGKARNQMSQFCDLCSEFSRFIAPAYHHDRCERSVQMRLYSMHKREFGLVFLAFFACFGMCVFIGLAGPPITSTTNQSISQVNGHPNGSDMATGPYYLATPLLTSYHQQFWVIAQIVTENKDDESFEKKFHVSIAMDGIIEDDQVIKMVSNDHTHNRTRDLQCERQNCSEILILHMGYFDYSHYALTIRFYGLESIHNRYVIRDVIFFFRSYNPAFTRLEIWFRFVFLLSTFIVTCWYFLCMKKYSVVNWSLEQRWMSVLMPLLILYNDPLFSLSFLIDSWFPGALDAVFQITFISALLLFWLCVYHGLRQNDRRLIFYLPKILLVGSIWLSMIIVAVWQEIEEVNDPTFSYKLDTEHFYGFKVFLIVASAIYLAYLVLLMIKAYSELRSMPFFDMRLKFLTLLVLFVLSISISVTFLRYGIGVLQDNFIAQLSTNYRNSSEFLALYGLLNFYIYTMAYVYSPTSNAVLEHSVMKDNPAFSMVNDSDEDVVYGSDDDGRKPLTINLTSKDDDSD